MSDRVSTLDSRSAILKFSSAILLSASAVRSSSLFSGSMLLSVFFSDDDDSSATLLTGRVIKLVSRNGTLCGWVRGTSEVF